MKFRSFIIVFALVLAYPNIAQIGNYINNGSFEDYYICNQATYPLTNCKFWFGRDSACFDGGFFSTCNSQVPANGNGFQYPHSGNSYVIAGQFCVNPPCGRQYLINRLKANLKSGVTYCVKYHVSITNSSPRGIDGFGIYFGNQGIDTITTCVIPITYLNPQVKNPANNIISDTLNWTSITGTFVATGNEKYAMIGNFLDDNAVATAPINGPFFPQVWTDVYFDDVSCIEVDLPAYAGKDTTIFPGTWVFLGRESDFATDTGCYWYQWPDLVHPLDTVSGLWVAPALTTTYIVKQTLECSSTKWDTVVVTVLDPTVGIGKLISNSNFGLFPNPAEDYIDLTFERNDLKPSFWKVLIYNNFGQVVREEEVAFTNKKAKIDVSTLPAGAYLIKATDSKNESVTKKLLISR